MTHIFDDQIINKVIAERSVAVTADKLENEARSEQTEKSRNWNPNWIWVNLTDLKKKEDLVVWSPFKQRLAHYKKKKKESPSRSKEEKTQKK